MSAYRMGGDMPRGRDWRPIGIYLRRWYSGGKYVTPTHWVCSPDTAHTFHRMLIVEIASTWRFEFRLYSWKAGCPGVE